MRYKVSNTYSKIILIWTFIENYEKGPKTKNLMLTIQHTQHYSRSHIVSH